MFVRRFIVSICCHLVIFPCHSWSVQLTQEQVDARKYIDERIKQAESVLRNFYEKVELVGDAGVIRKFKEILQKIAENKAGYWVLNEINKKLNNPQDKYKLNVKIDQDCPSFSPDAPNNCNPIIKFAIAPLSVCAIDSHILSQTISGYTVQQNVPVDVMLFHEILHWARLVIKGEDEWLQMLEDDEDKGTIVQNPIFSDYPTLNDQYPTIQQWKDVPNNKYLMLLSCCANSSNKLKGLPYAISNMILNPLSSDPWKISETVMLTEALDINLELPAAKQVKGVYKLWAQQATVQKIKIDEVRNIIGAGCSTNEMIDKISENTYRVAYNNIHHAYNMLYGAEYTYEKLNLRYGHNNYNCYINEKVVDWCRKRSVLK